MLSKTIEAGRTSGAVDDKSFEWVSVDTTVMEGNIAYPTDARLYERARQKLVALSHEAGVDLRQSYARLAPRLALGAAGGAPCPCEAIQAHAQGIEKAQRLFSHGNVFPLDALDALDETRKMR